MDWYTIALIGIHPENVIVLGPLSILNWQEMLNVRSALPPTFGAIRRLISATIKS